MSKHKISLVYLIWGTLAVIGFIAFFERWPEPFISLFILSIPFYLATLTLVIFVHPVLCLVTIIKKIKIGDKPNLVIFHLCWSIAITTAFVGMIMNGYSITV